MAEAKEPKESKVDVSSILSKEGSDLEKSAPKKKASSSADKSKNSKKKHRHTHIEHHDDGSHTVRHTPAGGGDEVSYSKPDLDGVHDGLEENIGEANTGEGQPMAAEPPQQQPAPPMSSAQPVPQGA